MVYDEWPESGFNLVTTLVKLRKLGLAHDVLFLIKLTVLISHLKHHLPYVSELDLASHLQSALELSLKIGQASLVLPDRSYYSSGLNNSLARTYYDVIQSVSLMAGAKREKAQIEAKEIFDFEAQLADVRL